MLSHLTSVFADGTATYGIEAARLTLERDAMGIMAQASESSAQPKCQREAGVSRAKLEPTHKD
jgi:hypothetical protein